MIPEMLENKELLQTLIYMVILLVNYTTYKIKDISLFTQEIIVFGILKSHKINLILQISILVPSPLSSQYIRVFLQMKYGF